MYKCVNVCLIARRLQVYPLHSSVTLEEQNGVFLVPVPGYRKVKFTLKHTCMFRVFEGCNGLNPCSVCTYRLFSPQTSLRVLSLCLTLNTVGVYFHTFCEFLRSSCSNLYILCIILCVMQWLTSALCVSWFAIRRPITDVFESPGRLRPVVTSVEVLHMWAEQHRFTVMTHLVLGFL